MANKLYTDDQISRIQSLEPNLLINGNFDYWQRDEGPVAFTTLDYYAPDRWLVRKQGTSSSATIELAESADVLGNMVLFKSLDTTTKYFNLYQRIEARDMEVLVGENVIFGCYVWTTSALEINCSAYTPNNAPDVWSSDFLDLNYVGSQDTDSPGGEWVWCEYSFTVPADGVDGLMIGVRNSGSITAVESMWVKEARLHRGTSILPDYLINTRTTEQEFALCQRYFQYFTYGMAAYGSGGNNCVAFSEYPVQMRAIPTISGDTDAYYFPLANCSTSTSFIPKVEGCTCYRVATIGGHIQFSGYASADAEL